MEKLMLRYNTLMQAVKTLEQALLLFENAHKKVEPLLPSEIFKEISLALRDSVIQRFEYTTDLLWKYLKDYLEIQLLMTPESRSPKNIIRTCDLVGLITEAEAEQGIAMIESRNMTSHIYHQEVAQEIMDQIPAYLQLIEAILQKTDPTKS